MNISHEVERGGWRLTGRNKRSRDTVGAHAAGQ